MAIEFFAQRINGRLVAETPADLESQEEMAAGVTYRVVATRAAGRSVQHHRLLFALIGIARDNYPEEISTEAVIATLKLRTGWVNVVALMTGEVIMVPKSISFQSMDRDAFNKWFPKAVTVLCRDFVPGLDEELARREIDKRAGNPAGLPGPTYAMAA